MRAGMHADRRACCHTSSMQKTYKYKSWLRDCSEVKGASEACVYLCKHHPLGYGLVLAPPASYYANLYWPLNYVCNGFQLGAQS